MDLGDASVLDAEQERRRRFDPLRERGEDRLAPPVSARERTSTGDDPHGARIEEVARVDETAPCDRALKAARDAFYPWMILCT